MKVGVRYSHGKLLFFKANPTNDQPSWAVDIREILAMIFVGGGAWFLVYVGEIEKAMYLLCGLLGYATGRTVPGGVDISRYRAKKEVSEKKAESV